MGKRNVQSPIDRFIALPDEEKDRIAAEFDQEFVAEKFKPLKPVQRQLWEKAKRKKGRPRVGKGAKRIMLAMERGLLERVDQFAKRAGVSRSQLVARGLEALLSAEPTPDPERVRAAVQALRETATEEQQREIDAALAVIPGASEATSKGK